MSRKIECLKKIASNLGAKVEKDDNTTCELLSKIADNVSGGAGGGANYFIPYALPLKDGYNVGVEQHSLKIETDLPYAVESAGKYYVEVFDLDDNFGFRTIVEFVGFKERYGEDGEVYEDPYLIADFGEWKLFKGYMTDGKEHNYFILFNIYTTWNDDGSGTVNFIFDFFKTQFDAMSGEDLSQFFNGMTLKAIVHKIA